MTFKLEPHKSIKVGVNTFNGAASIPVMYTKCPAGESTIQVSKLGGNTSCDILFSFKDNNGLFDLALVVDAIRRQNADTKIHLTMPYLPYARQDRVCNPGEPLSVKVVADFINALNFTSVTCQDLHSDVSGALINKLVHVEQKNLAYKLVEMFDNSKTLIVSPDAGAMKKTLVFAKLNKYTDVVCAHKVRNTLSGEITGVGFPGISHSSLEKDNILILDDICDGGATFVELVKALRHVYDYEGKICLYVTHGIFSKGFDGFDGLIDTIYVTNLMGDKPKSHNRVKLIQL